MQRQRRQQFLALFDDTGPNSSTPPQQSTPFCRRYISFAIPFFHAQAAGFASKIEILPDDNACFTATWRDIFLREIRNADTQRYKLPRLPPPAEIAEKRTAQVRVLLASNDFSVIQRMKFTLAKAFALLLAVFLVNTTSRADDVRRVGRSITPYAV